VIAITVKTNFPEVQRAYAFLRKDLGDRALVSAINKTLDQARTQMVRSITSEFNVTAAYVRDRLRIRRAVSRGQLRLEGSLIGGNAKGRSANIIRFVERKVTLAEGRRRKKAGTQNQVFVKVKRTGGLKPLTGAFIGNQGRTVFERTGSGRLPIKPVQVIDVAQMFNTRRVSKVVVDTIKSKFPDIFAREARFYVDRFNRGSKA
jgi:hypothetical protein